MGSKQTHGYIHIYMSLFENTMCFNRQDTQSQIGDTLLQFIYFDFKHQAKQSTLEAHDFYLAHPFFSFCEPSWYEKFLSQFSQPQESSDTITLGELQDLQKIYKDLLTQLLEHTADYEGTAFSSYLQEHDWLKNSGCFTRLNLTMHSTDSQTFCAEEYFVSSLEECLFLEFVEILKRKIIVKLCKNCGRLFIPKRTNMDYCTRIYTPDGKTCSDVGYTQTFARNVKNDELLLAYTRAYKAHYARMTKPRKRAANMTRQEFEAWYIEAKKKLELARSGVLDAELFKAWLKD